MCESHEGIKVSIFCVLVEGIERPLSIAMLLDSQVGVVTWAGLQMFTRIHIVRNYVFLSNR